LLEVALNKALNVSEDASHRGGVLTRNLTSMLCSCLLVLALPF
jgi:hypothetical protein